MRCQRILSADQKIPHDHLRQGIEFVIGRTQGSSRHQSRVVVTEIKCQVSGLIFCLFCLRACVCVEHVALIALSWWIISLSLSSLAQAPVLWSVLYPQISAPPSSDSGGPVTDLSACYPSLVLPCELHLPVGGGGFRCPGAVYISPEEGLSLPKRFCFSRHGLVHARAFSCCPRGRPSPSPPAPPYHSHLSPCGRALPPSHGLSPLFDPQWLSDSCFCPDLKNFCYPGNWFWSFTWDLNTDLNFGKTFELWWPLGLANVGS